MPFGQTSQIPGPFSSVLNSLFWYLLAMLVCLSVFFINGAPLPYFDTFAYLNRGLFLIELAKDILGIDASSAASDTVQLSQNQNAADAQMIGQKALDGSPSNEGRTISASRSRVYSFVIGSFATVRHLEYTVFLSAALVIAAVWLPVRVAARHYPSALAVAPTVAIPLVISAFGSLPFFVAYLMPDIFAPILILTLASLAVFARDMRRWEILASIFLGCFAVTAHITHLAIAASMVPVVALASLLIGRPKWWLAPAIVVFMSVFGYVEQITYRVAVQATTDLEAVFQPFLTARLIQDRVGYDYLQRHCPDEEIVTCDLYEALSKSDNPRRLTASHIMFRKSEDLGSFLLMEEDQRRSVAQAQFKFFFDVLAEAPGGTILAMVRNTLAQAQLNNVNQTIIKSSGFGELEGVDHLNLTDLHGGRLTEDLSWLGTLTKFHKFLYLTSLIVISLSVVWPGVLPKKIKALVILILLGILANAFLCGAFSQPAARYGGRVIWLLPWAATMSVLYASFLARRVPKDLPLDGNRTNRRHQSAAN